MSLPQERSTAGLVSYTWVARSRSGSSSFTALALNKPSLSSSYSSSSSSSSSFTALALNEKIFALPALLGHFPAGFWVFGTSWHLYGS